MKKFKVSFMHQDSMLRDEGSMIMAADNAYQSMWKLRERFRKMGYQVILDQQEHDHAAGGIFWDNGMEFVRVGWCKSELVSDDEEVCFVKRGK